MGCDADPFSWRLRGRGREHGCCERRRPARGLGLRCASKSAMRVLHEVASVSGADNGAKLLVRRSRGLSRVAQMEVLAELVQRGQCELALPVSC
jgi:hypothetical protein